jgi:diketogulonate reductase-like aldo/keto reductase
MIFNETYTLANGVNIPKLGLGTWMINDTKVSEAVRQAVSIFLVDDLENVLAGCAIKPMVNQILRHVGNTPLELIGFVRKMGLWWKPIHRSLTARR